MFSFFVNLNKLLNKQQNCRWFATPLRSFDATAMLLWSNYPCGLTELSKQIKTEERWWTVSPWQHHPKRHRLIFESLSCSHTISLVKLFIIPARSMVLYTCALQWGSLNQFPKFVIFYIFQSRHHNNLLNNTFIFDWHHRSLAAVTPVNYGCNSNWWTHIFPELDRMTNVRDVDDNNEQV